MMSQRGNDLGRPQPTTESQMMSPLVRYLMFILTGKTGPMAMVESIAMTDRPEIYPGTEAIMVGVTAMTKPKTRVYKHGHHVTKSSGNIPNANG